MPDHSGLVQCLLHGEWHVLEKANRSDHFANCLRQFSPHELLSVQRPLTDLDGISDDAKYLTATARLQLLQAKYASLQEDWLGFSRRISAFSVALQSLHGHFSRVANSAPPRQLLIRGTDVVALETTYRSLFALHQRLQESSFPRRMTLVLGMHRSGTSAMTGMLKTAGLDAPIDPLGATENNPYGYWESTRLVLHTDQFLEANGYHWSSLFCLPQSWLYSAEALEWGHRYLEAFEDVYPQSTHILLKDPRLCILSRAFLPWLQSGFVDVDVVLILRRPLEVAFSLQKAEGLSLLQAVCLWISSVLESEQISRAFPRLIVTYEQLLDSPDQVLLRCQKLFGRATGQAAGVLSADAIRFVQSSSRRQRVEELTRHLDASDSVVSLLNFADQIYDIFQDCSDDQMQELLLDYQRRWQLISTSLMMTPQNSVQNF